MKPGRFSEAPWRLPEGGAGGRGELGGSLEAWEALGGSLREGGEGSEALWRLLEAPWRLPEGGAGRVSGGLGEAWEAPWKGRDAQEALWRPGRLSEGLGDSLEAP